MNVQDLQREYGRSGRVRFLEDPNLGPVCILRGGPAIGIVALRGGLVSRIRLPVERSTGPRCDKRCARDILWMSACPPASPSKPWRGGIPVCWPWFGAHPAEASAPSHGFLRTMPWRVVSVSARAGLAEVSLVPERSAWPDAEWAQPFRDCEVVLRFTVGQTSAEVALWTRNKGPQPVKISQALHTYLRVPDIREVSVTGLEGATYIDALDGWQRKQQDGAIRFAGEVDRIYLHANGRGSRREDATIQVLDRGDGDRGSRIDVISSGSGSSVVWNPWIEKSERMGDMNPEGGKPGYLEMVCVETANAADDAVMIAPGERHVLKVSLTASALDAISG